MSTADPDARSLGLDLPSDMVLFHPGTLPLGWGSDADHVDGPAHPTWVDWFALSKYEVSVGEFKSFVDANKLGSGPPWPWVNASTFEETRDLPITQVVQLDNNRGVVQLQVRW